VFYRTSNSHTVLLSSSLPFTVRGGFALTGFIVSPLFAAADIACAVA